jgi:hypothetical protein
MPSKTGWSGEMVKRWMAVVLAAGVIVGAMSAQDAISPELVEHIEEIETFTSEARGLEELEPVERLFPTREEAVNYVLALYEEEFPADEAQRLSLLYQAFDLLPPDSDYLTTYLDLLSAQIGGFYEPETDEMNVLLMSGEAPGDELPLLEQIVYAHEFTHALQDQHFDLEAVQAQAGDNRDYAQAILSLIEGDATVVMTLYTQAIAERNPFGTALQLLAQGIDTNTLTLPPGTPAIIESELLSAYLDGSVFVTALYDDGGWKAVDAAYRNLPQSTEQILHPEKYLAGEAPITITLEPAALDEEWETIWDNTLGEFYLREYLLTQLDRSDAEDAAAGWGGDHYQVFYNERADELAWVLRIVWDSPEEAKQFTEAYGQFIDARYPGEVAGNDSCWTDDVNTLCLVVEDATHTLAVAPTHEMAAQLAATP